MQNESDSLFVSNKLVQALCAFRNEFRPTKSVVYWPNSGQNISASVVFRGRRVLYINDTEANTRALQKKGCYLAYTADPESFMTVYEPGILLLIDFRKSPLTAIRCVPEDGLIFCDNKNGVAETIKAEQSCTLLGGITMTEKGPEATTSNPDQFWKQSREPGGNADRNETFFVFRKNCPTPFIP